MKDTNGDVGDTLAQKPPCYKKPASKLNNSLINSSTLPKYLKVWQRCLRERDR